MQETYIQQDMFAPQKGECQESEKRVEHRERRKVAGPLDEQPLDFSQVDFTEKDVCDSLARALRVFLSSRRPIELIEGENE